MQTIVGRGVTVTNTHFVGHGRAPDSVQPVALHPHGVKFGASNRRVTLPAHVRQNLLGGGVVHIPMGPDGAVVSGAAISSGCPARVGRRGVGSRRRAVHLLRVSCLSRSGAGDLRPVGMRIDGGESRTAPKRASASTEMALNVDVVWQIGSTRSQFNRSRSFEADSVILLPCGHPTPIYGTVDDIAPIHGEDCVRIRNSMLYGARWTISGSPTRHSTSLFSTCPCSTRYQSAAQQSYVPFARAR